MELKEKKKMCKCSLSPRNHRYSAITVKLYHRPSGHAMYLEPQAIVSTVSVTSFENESQAE